MAINKIISINGKKKDFDVTLQNSRILQNGS